MYRNKTVMITFVELFKYTLLVMAYKNLNQEKNHNKKYRNKCSSIDWLCTSIRINIDPPDIIRIKIGYPLHITG